MRRFLINGPLIKEWGLNAIDLYADRFFFATFFLSRGKVDLILS